MEDFTALLSSMADALEPELDRPFAFFGHSLGALLAFELAAGYVSEVVAARVLFVSGRSAPQIPDELITLAMGCGDAGRQAPRAELHARTSATEP